MNSGLVFSFYAFFWDTRSSSCGVFKFVVIYAIRAGCPKLMQKHVICGVVEFYGLSFSAESIQSNIESYLYVNNYSIKILQLL